MPWTKTGATHYLSQFGLQDKGRTIKGSIVYTSWNVSVKRLGPALLSDLPLDQTGKRQTANKVS